MTWQSGRQKILTYPMATRGRGRCQRHRLSRSDAAERPYGARPVPADTDLGQTSRAVLGRKGFGLLFHPPVTGEAGRTWTYLTLARQQPSSGCQHRCASVSPFPTSFQWCTVASEHTTVAEPSGSGRSSVPRPGNASPFASEGNPQCGMQTLRDRIGLPVATAASVHNHQVYSKERTVSFSAVIPNRKQSTEKI